MTRPSHPTPLNRTTLGVTGLALAVTGTWLGLGAGTGTALLPPGRLAHLRAESWWAPTTTATAITLTLLFALWSLRQLRPPTARRLALPTPGCTMRPRALAEALAARANAVPGVTRGHARVRPRRGRRLEVELRVWLAPDTSPDAVLPALRALTTEADTTTAPYTTHTTLRLSAAAHRTPHVR